MNAANGFGLEGEPCPHCAGRTRVEPDARYRFVCAACGGPRVPADAPGLALGDELAPLRRAREAQLGAVRSAGAATGMGLLAVALAIIATGIVLGGAVPAAVVAGALAVIVAVLALSQRARAASLRKAGRDEADEAGMRVALAVLRARGSDLTAAELARTMRLEETDAEALLTALASKDRVRVDIHDGDAALHWSTANPPMAGGAPTVAASPLDAAAPDLEPEAEPLASKRAGGARE